MFLFAMLPLLVAHAVMAEGSNSVAVGTCKPKLSSFASIQAAISKVAPGTTILVCPGVYPEQITISQPLTLQGIADNNVDQITITVPTSGLAANVTSMFGQSVAAQVLIQNAAPVNIVNIAVDGTGGDRGCATWLAGIFYSSGSSGSVNRIKASGQINAGCGVGIWAENAGSSNQFVSIQGSSVHDIDNAGIFAGSGTTPTLNVLMKDNFISMPAAGVVLNSVTGQVTNNDVSNALGGILDLSPGARISSNNLTSSTIGVFLAAGGTVDSNHISNSGIGVFTGGGGNVQSNRITVATIGIEFLCSTSTAANNTINDATTGLDFVPATFTGRNIFANTAQISTDGCTAAAAQSSTQSVFQRLTRSGVSPSKWRTPANPLGVRALR
jgi:hypothetical protein